MPPVCGIRASCLFTCHRRTLGERIASSARERIAHVQASITPPRILHERSDNATAQTHVYTRLPARSGEAFSRGARKVCCCRYATGFPNCRPGRRNRLDLPSEFLLNAPMAGHRAVHSFDDRSFKPRNEIFDSKQLPLDRTRVFSAAERRDISLWRTADRYILGNM